MDAEVNIEPLPTSLNERVAIDRLSLSIYVDKRISGDPLLLTWVSRNKHKGIVFKIVPLDVDEVAKLRAGGMRITEDVDDEMLVRGHAIEIIRKAAAYSSPDIHFMMRGTHTEIQIVVKDELRVLERKTQREGEALARAIFQGIAKTKDRSYNPLEFQNAQIPGDALPPDIGLTSIRIIRGPSYPQAENGGFMTMRLQYSSIHSGSLKSDKLPALELPRRPPGNLRLLEMGFSPAQVAKVKVLMDAPNGVVIVTGPTGSGKTTTLHEAMKDIARNKPQRRLVTIEDPVEYPMEWAVQMAVTDAHNDQETGEAFGDRIRVALRMAPHIILVGELRGPKVASSALEASLTGHQVWTTMHVTDPFLFVERLEMMDRTQLDRRVFCDHKIVRGVIAQRLIPRLCSECSISLQENESLLDERIIVALKSWGDIENVRLRGNGCSHCNNDGTLERFAVAEVVVFDAATMSDFIEHGTDIARDNYRARSHADASMLESAIMHVLNGEVDPRSVEDKVDLIEPKERRRK